MSNARLCEYCHRKAVTTARVLDDDGEWLFPDPVPLCRRCARDAENGQSFSGCETRTEWERWQEIRNDVRAYALICEMARWEQRTLGAVLRDHGDPREWPDYGSDREVPPVPPRGPAPGYRTHEFWAVHQHHWTGLWYIQRAGRQGLGTVYDPPLPGHDAFSTRKAAEKFKRNLPQ